MIFATCRGAKDGTFGWEYSENSQSETKARCWQQTADSCLEDQHDWDASRFFRKGLEQYVVVEQRHGSTVFAQFRAHAKIRLCVW